MIVMKFGGSSVESAAAIQRAASIVAAQRGRNPVVVVSAMGKTTNRLLSIASAAVSGQREQALGELASLQAFHRLEAGGLALDSFLDAHFQELAELVKGLAVMGELTPRATDAISAYGERLSSVIVNAAFEKHGIPSRHIDARTLIVTDRRHTQAAPLFAETYARCERALTPGPVWVMGGFIASTGDGATSTLGRGGSDYTAALLGAVLHTARVEIWTDVCGLMTADPRIVPSARTLAEASYDEAAELATFGAKVLHPATAMPLVRAGIPIVILNSTAPERPGTVIEPEAELERLGDSPIRSISWKKGVTVLNIRAPRMLGAYGFLRRLFEVFERHEIVVDVLASSEVSVSLSIENASQLEAVVRDLADLGEVRVNQRRAIVAVVGVGLHTTPGIAARVFSTVAPVNVEVISQGASASNITFIVQEDDGVEVVRKLHQEFFGSC
jgi:aspartate kinase